MKKKLFLVIACLFIIAGLAISYVCKFPTADVTGFALTMFGAGLACAALWEKKDKEQKTWLCALGIALLAIGSFACGFGGMIESTFTSLVTCVVGLIGIIAGIILSSINNQKKQ